MTLKWILILAVGVLIVKTCWHYAGEVRTQVAHIEPAPLLLAFVLCSVYRVVNPAGWVLVLRSMGQSIGFRHGIRLWLLTESTRWLPGSIWGLCSRVYQATRSGIPAAVASASLPVELLLTIGAWSLVAATGVAASGFHFDWKIFFSPRFALMAVAVITICGIAAAASFAKWPENRIAKKVKGLVAELKSLKGLRLRFDKLALTALLYSALCVLSGIAFYFVLTSISRVEIPVIPVVAINACGWLMGFLAVGAPSGIGVREAGVALLLQTLMPLPEAIAGAVLWRLILIADELTCLGICLLAGGAVGTQQKPAEQTLQPV